MDQPSLHKFFKTHDYKEVVSRESVADTANYWAGMGWRTVSVVLTTAQNTPVLILERPVGIKHPSDEAHRY